MSDRMVLWNAMLGCHAGDLDPAPLGELSRLRHYNHEGTSYTCHLEFRPQGVAVLLDQWEYVESIFYYDTPGLPGDEWRDRYQGPMPIGLRLGADLAQVEDRLVGLPVLSGWPTDREELAVTGLLNPTIIDSPDATEIVHLIAYAGDFTGRLILYFDAESRLACVRTTVDISVADPD